mgnify:FL=1
MADETTTYQMTNARPENYWIAPDALYITLNAMGQPDYLQGNVSSGAVIMCYMRGIDGLSFDAGPNYRRWPLAVAPTYFNTSTPKYVYAAIPKSEAVNAYAQIVYPSEKIDLYGKNANGEQIGVEGYYFVFLQGIISASVATDGTTQMRSWTQRVDCGSLSSDEAIAAGGIDTWWKYSSVDDTVTFIKTIAKAVFDNITAKIATVSKLILGGKPLTDVAEYPKTSSDSKTDVVTPKYVSDHGEKEYLSKTKDDATLHKLTIGETEVTGKSKTHGNADFLSDVVIGEQGFADGMTGFGIKFGKDGAMQGDSLTLRRFIEVPELRYNRVEVFVGNQWRAPGAGIVKTVVSDTNSAGTTANTGTVYLKLEEGEIGKIAVDDICMGIFHDNNTANNSTDDYDDYKGNFRFSGFYTCYFRITEITETATNSSFRYALREYSDGTFSKHPSAYMHFVCYGNFTNKDRQSSRYSTLRYERMLVNVNTWEFQAANIAMQEGDLDNLKVYGLDMTGYSIYLENIYMSGTIKQIEKLAVRMEIENTFSEVLDFGETAPLRIFLTRGFDDFTEKAVKWSVTRDSGDATNDAAWQQKAKVVAFNNTPTIKTTEDGQRKYVGFDISFKDGDNDLSMDELSTLFTFKAYDKDSAVLATKSIAI